MLQTLNTYIKLGVIFDYYVGITIFKTLLIKKISPEIKLGLHTKRKELF
jgi:hypothetical protein